MGQNLARHQAVLGFLKTKISRQGEIHEQIALYVARSHGGVYILLANNYLGAQLAERPGDSGGKKRMLFKDEFLVE